MLFREQGITIASILTAIRMAIGVLVEVLPGGGTAVGGSNSPHTEDEKGVKEWLRNKRKALASLLGKLDVKAAEALPGITGAIISWILNRAKEVADQAEKGGMFPPKGKFMKLNFGMLSSKIEVIRTKKGVIILVLTNIASFSC